MGSARNPFGELVSQVVGDQVRASPVVDEVRRRFNAWRDPRAKALRARKRAVRATTTWGGLTAVSGGGAALEFAYVNDGAFAYGLAGFGALTLIATLSSGMRTRRLYKVPLPEPARERQALPPNSSRAHEPMRRLDAAEQTLHELLGELRTPSGAVPVVPGGSLDSAAGAAATAAENLRGLAARLQAIERSRAATAPADRAALNEPIDTLAGQLHEGVDEYGKLVAAAARAVAASASRPSSTAVTEATDELSGLASALQELSRHFPR
ncbi:phage shock envelope stress response protein PspM [Sciscionella marina]|uniref:phage shock envelope stress response protein PspM n=1 Tax=Sciscionella marina TaxID=508770 RepID=UPI000374D0DE|nr:hypothetical protein [Sciscionella marina]